jgi:acetylornithine deacetylase/succinyl-diaminopimelate desuccinylase-like protein
MIEIDTDYLIETLKQAIRINSIIPNEEKLAAFFSEKIRSLGIEPEWHLVAPGRPNVYASADLGPKERFFTLTGHLDTVDVALSWPTDPFDPIEIDGLLYGLGSLDMKAGLVCALAAFKALLETKEIRGKLGRLGLALTVDEEGYGLGAKALLQTEYGQSDALLLGEPYFGSAEARDLPIGLTGKVLYKLTVRGKMAHGFSPEDGINAVEDAGRILEALDRLKIGHHPDFGYGNFATLKIEGGYSEYAVVVPEFCEIIITRLTGPGESVDSAISDMQTLVNSLNLASEISIETPPPFYESYIIDENSDLLNIFKGVYQEVVGHTPRLGYRRGITDANIFVAEGSIPTITFGPHGGGAHGAGEYVEIDTLKPVAQIFAETAIRYLKND